MYKTNKMDGARVNGKRKFPVKTALLILAGIIIAGLATIVVLQQLNRDQDSQSLQSKVSKIMLLPDEEAVISDIEDASKIKDQPFFAQAENGDKVLIFPKAAKIVIYRPSQRIIVNVGPIVNDTESQQDSSAAE